jgi:hypothetical protein
MRHARPEDLKPIAALLAQLRDLPGLTEKTAGTFYRGSKAFLHFHEDAGKLFADLKLGSEFERFPVSTDRERKAFLKAANAALSSSIGRAD